MNKSPIPMSGIVQYATCHMYPKAYI